MIIRKHLKSGIVLTPSIDREIVSHKIVVNLVHINGRQGFRSTRLKNPKGIVMLLVFVVFFCFFHVEAHIL